MNTKNKYRWLVTATVAVLAITVFLSCDLKDDDFSDIQIIQDIIKKDTEDIYGVEKADDDSLFEASTLGKAAAGSQFGFRFQRRVATVSRSVEVTIIADTLAEAHVIYDLQGTFRVDSMATTLAVKPFNQRLERYIGFVKRPERDSVTGKTWRPTGFTPAFGASTNSNGQYQTAMGFDSLFIRTPNAEYLVDDPGDLFLFYRNPLRLTIHDTIIVRIKAFNQVDLLDLPLGFVKSGRNNDRFSRKFQMNRIPGSFVYEYRLVVDNKHPRGFNQLVLDFLTTGTILRRSKPYDSRLIMIPYRVN